jgi:ribosomal protein S5
MALPKLNSMNELPEYETTIPSTNKPVKFRPFLVKEQKVLLMAMESQDTKQIVSAVTNTISACVKDKISINALTTYDVEYLFTQIRAKAVGEKATINAKCEKCETANEVSVDLTNVKVDKVKSSSGVIVLSDTIKLTLKHPGYNDILKLDLGLSSTENMMGLVYACLDSVQTEDENIKISDESAEEIEAFIDSLAANQLEEILQFVKSVPAVTYDLDFDCTDCKEHNHTVLRGLNSFF